MIDVSRLTKAYGSQPVLREVSFSVPAGSVLTVLGPNGSGKTTLLRLLATLTRPTAGSGRIAGYDLVGDRDAVRRLVGLVGHGTHLYDDLTAIENLAFAAALAHLPADRGAVLAALASVGAEGHGTVPARQLSSGMRRRVAVARALLARPRLLLLDEPFAGLDHDGAKRLEATLHAFKAAGGTTVYVTHNLARGVALADRVLILSGGRSVVNEPRGVITPDDLQRLYLAAVEGEA
jgi:heme exporter protein A